MTRDTLLFMISLVWRAALAVAVLWLITQHWGPPRSRVPPSPVRRTTAGKRGRGTSVPRQLRRLWRLRARRFNLVGHLFCFGWRGKLLIMAFGPTLSRDRQWGRPRKSGEPPPFALSLKIQRNAH